MANESCWTQTFLKALTADVQDFNVENKSRLSTNYQDVMSNDSTHHDLSLAGTTEHTAKESSASSLDDKEDATQKNKAFKRLTGYRENEFVPTVYTAPQVDNTLSCDFPMDLFCPVVSNISHSSAKPRDCLSGMHSV